MFLTFDATGVDSRTVLDFKLDLTGIIDNDDNVACEDTLFTSMVMRLSKWALEKGVGIDALYPLYIHDGEYWEDDSEQLDAGQGDESWAWIKEVAQFAWYAHDNDRDDWDQLFAVVSGVGWKWVDFDDLRSAVEDDYHTEFNGDYAAFGEEWCDELTEGVPDHLRHHIDWDSYGRELVDDFAEYEWNDRTFLYNQ